MESNLEYTLACTSIRNMFIFIEEPAKFNRTHTVLYPTFSFHKICGIKYSEIRVIPVLLWLVRR